MRPPSTLVHFLFPFLLAGFGALLAGCGSAKLKLLELMPAPAAYAAEAAPFGAEAAPAIDATARIEMLYATNRAPADTAAAPYTGERGQVLRLGAAAVAFGESDIDWARAREISLLKNRPGHFPLKVAGVTEFGILPDSVSAFTPHALAEHTDGRAAREFVQRVEQQLARSSVKDIFIYVHGYKVIFDNPLMVASELWHFMGYEGAFVAFSWPSTPARLAYLKDIETARLSAQSLRTLIEFLARETSAARIHVVGYSAGTRLVLASLYESALIHQSSSDADIRRATRLGHVILVGSDVDSDVFASYVVDGLLRVPERLTFYTSPADEALHLSSRIFDHVRMGQILPGMLDTRMREFVAASDRLTLIDVEGAADFDAGNGHAYFRRSPWVSSDVLMTLRYGLPPASRGLEQKAPSPIWRFPADYLERSDRALRAANPALDTGQPP
ncbi:MAG: alpha/beta hydrolase [Gammaproteobacteria bacterium]